jgi:hypothetical protein
LEYARFRRSFNLNFTLPTAKLMFAVLKPLAIRESFRWR